MKIFFFNELHHRIQLVESNRMVCLKKNHKKFQAGEIGGQSRKIFSARKIAGHVTFKVVLVPVYVRLPSYGEITQSRHSKQQIKYLKFFFCKTLLGF